MSEKTILCESLLERRFILSEGPGYDSRSGRMFWVDIKTGSLFLYDDKTKNLKEIQTGQYLGAAVPARQGGFLAAMSTGLYHCDETGISLFARPPELRDNLRINDGKCDPAGRFWFGTIALFQNVPPGFLLRLDSDGSCRPMQGGVKVSNGLAWSSDGKTMYFTDTAERATDAFDFNLEEGKISNRRRIITFSGAASAGFPDGMTIDEEDKLWIALWGGGKVIRCDPATAEILAEIKVPATNVSSCAFVGENLDDLLITSSGEGFTDPMEGRCFITKPGVRGRATHLFG
ncbi:hypothetical protein AGMMS49928_28380 [Spirochaetia bacterium]|nr:hypothetical protein AGMMS49928_28380 [Spirochaetia bacterium]